MKIRLQRTKQSRMNEKKIQSKNIEWKKDYRYSLKRKTKKKKEDNYQVTS